MIGRAPLNAVWRFAPRAPHTTRCEYAVLAELARGNGDLPFAAVGKRRARLVRLAKRGLVRRVPGLRRWELRARGWNLLTCAEDGYRLSREA